MSNPLPPSLDHFRHYFEADRIEWGQTKPGWGIVIEAQDPATKQLGSFGFQIVDTVKGSNGLSDAWVELDYNSFNFTTNPTERQRLLLPKGTLMRAGTSCEHFPRTNAGMAYLGGISVGRDFSFEEVQTPDGKITEVVLVPKVQAVHSFLPENDTYTPPDSYASYCDAVTQSNETEKTNREKWTKSLDELIDSNLQEYFPESPEEREALQTIFATFHPDGRYTLAAMMACARAEGTLNNFKSVLEAAVKVEFSYTPPVVARGLDLFPATQRGWDMMIRGLELEKYTKK